jgi:hypothetical protein
LHLYFDVVYVSDETGSSHFSEEIEREEEEEEEENWDLPDEMSDSFDPSGMVVWSLP